MLSGRLLVLGFVSAGIVFTSGLMAQPAVAANVATSVTEANLPKSKRTTAGLYVSSKEAAAAMAADPQSVFVDVRTVAEYVFVGAPVNAYNVPFRVFVGGREARATNGQYKMANNPDFVAAFSALMKKLGKDKSATIFVTCRSGSRSAGSINVLHKLGYTNVYSIVDGFEGDRDKKTGKRTVNGWRNSGLAWTSKVDKALLYRPPAN